MRNDETPKIGHNSNLTADEKLKLGGFISEIERVEAQARVLATDKSELYKSAKEAGFDTKALRHVVKMRRMGATERQELENAIDSYAVALGDFITTDLGRAAVQRATESHKPPVAKLPETDTSNPPFNVTDDDEPRVADPGDDGIPEQFRRTA